jgi:hypothetical protein
MVNLGKRETRRDVGRGEDEGEDEREKRREVGSGEDV